MSDHASAIVIAFSEELASNWQSKDKAKGLWHR